MELRKDSLIAALKADIRLNPIVSGSHLAKLTANAEAVETSIQAFQNDLVTNLEEIKNSIQGPLDTVQSHCDEHFKHLG